MYTIPITSKYYVTRSGLYNLYILKKKWKYEVLLWSIYNMIFDEKKMLHKVLRFAVYSQVATRVHLLCIYRKWTRPMGYNM